MSSSKKKIVIETKVVIATFASLVAGVLLAVLTEIEAAPEVLAGLPEPAQFVFIAALPPVLTFLAGFAAPHTDRVVVVPPLQGEVEGS